MMLPPCVCGHSYGAHEHYRKGSDCDLCGCHQYKARRYKYGGCGVDTDPETSQWTHRRTEKVS